MSFRQGDQQQEQETRHLSQSRHTCAHCQKLVIDPTKPISPANRAGKSWTEIRNTFKYTVAELLQAGKDSCPIFERIVTRGIEYDSWSVSSNNNRSVDVHFDLITSMTPLNVTKVKVICHWTDTDEGLMNSEGIKQNTYSVEAESDDPAGIYVRKRPNYPYVVSDFTYDIIRAWLEKCDDHADCISAIQMIYNEDNVLLPGPSRLIFINSNATSTTNAKLVNTTSTEKYIALSYCWGKDGSMQLLRNNLDIWKEELPYGELPQTIQDAISTTRKLGLEYLWVDRVCIIQDDYEDVKKELSAMARIYQRSFLTISAASAPSATDGFLQFRPQASEVMRSTRIALGYRCPNGVVGTVGLKTQDFRNEEYIADMKAVDARAWTTQEQLLSTRIVHFCTNMLYWNCQRGWGAHMHEEGAPRIPTNQIFADPDAGPSLSPILPRSETMKWSLIVHQYTQRQLSFPADKLVAISALAQRFAEILRARLGKEPRYLAGLWEHNLSDSLCWYLDPNTATPQRRAVAYIAPSWSWASVDGEVQMMDDNIAHGTISCEVVACDVKLVSSSMPFHSVLSGSLIIKGRLKEDIWDRKRQKLLGAMGRDYKKNDAPDGVIDALETELVGDEYGTIPVFCLLMGKRGENPYGLILIKGQGDSAWYKRVGFFEMELFEGTHNAINFVFDDCKEQVITII